MAIFDGIKRQLRSVIEWQNPQPNVLFQQWSEQGDEIKNASKLIVGPGQGCIFVYEGKVQSVLTHECMIDLNTENIPFWTTIKKFMQFFESEHKVGLYFFRTSKILDQKWGTLAPIRYDDPKYKFPVGLKAFGNYSYRIAKAGDFFTNIVGSQQQFYIDDFRQIMSNRIMHPLSDFLAESKYSFAEIDAHREEIVLGLQSKLDADFAKLGFKITDFRIEGTDFDDDTKARINRIADLSAEAQAAQAVGLDFAQLQQLQALRDAAQNEAGGAGIGMGMGAGMGLGQSMAQAMDIKPATAAPEKDIMNKLTQLKQIFEAGLITEAEYNDKKKQVLDGL